MQKNGDFETLNVGVLDATTSQLNILRMGKYKCFDECNINFFSSIYTNLIYIFVSILGKWLKTSYLNVIQ